jgi:hypothetical protein
LNFFFCALLVQDELRAQKYNLSNLVRILEVNLEKAKEHERLNHDTFDTHRRKTDSR